MSKQVKFIGFGILALVAVFVCLQILPVWALRTNPPVISEPDWPNTEAQAIAQRACYDCHSNETNWPWYSYVAPPSWLVIIDVVRARDEVNFSDWAEKHADEPKDFEEVLEEGEMPPDNYIMMHPEAKLSEVERETLIEAFEAMTK